MVELDPLVTAAENKGAVGQLLSMLPRYARVVQERQRAFVYVARVRVCLVWLDRFFFFFRLLLVN